MEYSDIARVCHEANRALQVIQADPTIPVSVGWDELDEETKASAVRGVEGVLVDGNDPAASHETWCEFKLSHGWRHGDVKDEVEKTHPLLVPYGELPVSAKLKDALFYTICHTLEFEGDGE